MAFWDLKLFKEIATNRSISRGATHSGVTQSAASQHLQEVERRLGTQLLDRSKRPLEVTPAGRLYLDLCRDVLKRDEQFVRDLAALKQNVEGTVRVASIYSIGLSEMSRVQDEFAVRFPSANLHVEYVRPEKVYAAVRSGETDFGMVSYPEASRELAVIPWRDEEMQVAAGPTHPLAGRPVLELADLQGQDFIGFDEDLKIRRELDRFLKAHGIEVNLAMHFDNIQMIKEAVAVGVGISILPARTMQAEIAQGRLVSIPLDAPELARPVGILHRKRKKFSRAEQAFLEMLLARPAKKREAVPVWW